MITILITNSYSIQCPVNGDKKRERVREKERERNIVREGDLVRWMLYCKTKQWWRVNY